MTFPLGTSCAWILIPVRPANEINKAVAVHIEGRDALRMVISEAMHQEAALARPSVHSRPWVLHAHLLLRDKNRTKKQRQPDELSHRWTSPQLVLNGCKVTVRLVPLNSWQHLGSA